MLTLFHSPHSRSSAIVALVEEMGIADRLDLRVVTIPRADGTGRRDPANPHPEGKVPALVHDGRVITERGAIILHLCALFPEAGMAPLPGTPDWGTFAGWMAWYQGVLEPVVVTQNVQNNDGGYRQQGQQNIDACPINSLLNVDGDMLV